jgi:DNA-binding NarL/FixJ family response regulator
MMIADDSNLLRDDMIEILRSEKDIEVIAEANSGREIVSKALENDFDIVLMDIEMESMNAGINATREILDIKPDAQIIYLTAHETEEIILVAMGTGAKDYFVKGHSQDELITHIRNVYNDIPTMDNKVQDIVMHEYKRLKNSEQGLLFFIKNISKLTATERELVRLLLNDNKVKDIARIRCVEMVTVKTQISTILKKFGVKRTKEIVKMIKELKIQHLF